MMIPVNRAPGNETPGISVVIATHNGARKLTTTLEHIAAQDLPSTASWEVILVDNASTDDTADIARSAWPDNSPVPLIVLTEGRLGKTHALNAGFAQASHPYICIVDDDNWLPPDYLAAAIRIMDRHPEAAVCGGRSEAYFEKDPPAWFHSVSNYYALGDQQERTGYVDRKRYFLWGAGSVYRRSALQGLNAAGYGQYSTGLMSPGTMGGEDVELCLALQLAGWRLYYSPQLVFRHFMPADRLTWSYARQLLARNGQFTPLRKIYLALLDVHPGLDQPDLFLWKTFMGELFLTLRKWHYFLVLPFGSLRPGSKRVLFLERQLSGLRKMLQMRSEIPVIIRQLREVAWSEAGRADRQHIMEEK
jgi:cellulose synthase/poly-beta-1,6-N-acetylglucosamine synthase-like glycosyltransferase